jgi:hypothetical protein
VIIIAGVELTLTGDESTDDSEGAGVDVSFWIDYREKCRVLSTNGGEIVFSNGGLKFKEHGWALKDANATDCS